MIQCDDIYVGGVGGRYATAAGASYVLGGQPRRSGNGREVYWWMMDDDGRMRDDIIQCHLIGIIINLHFF